MLPRVEPLCKETEKLLRSGNFMENDYLEISTGNDKHGVYWIFQVRAHRVDGTQTTASVFAAKHWFARIPERKELGYGRWRIEITDMAAIIVHSVWKESAINFMDEEARVTFQYLILRFATQTDNAIIKAKFKELGEVPAPPHDYVDHPKYPLAPYQTIGALTSVNQEGAALFMEQGTGKTPVAIRRMMYEANRVWNAEGRMYRAILAVPRNVRTNWKKEIARFATVPGKVVVLKGSQLDRVKQLTDIMTTDETSQFAIIITSYETVQRSWQALGLFEWDLALLDESHYIKSPRTARTQTMFKLRDNARQRMVLTGTPVGNSVQDLWSQLEFLGKGFSGFTTFKAFRAFYIKFQQNGDYQEQVGVRNLPLLHERLARVGLFFTKREVLPDLPEKQWDTLEVVMSKPQRDLYKAMQQQLAAEIEADIEKAEEDGRNMKMTATNALTKLLRLSQITSGYAVVDQEYTDDGDEKIKDRIRPLPVNPKLDLIIEELKKRDPKSKTIIWACWVPAIRMIAARLKEEGIGHVEFYGSTSDKDRDLAMQKFNEDPDCKVFLGNPAAGGVGLNLPGYNPDWTEEEDLGTNADWMIFFASNWSHLQRSQAEDRNHGKNRCRVPGRITEVIVPGTIDEEIADSLKDKKTEALQVQDVRAIMKRLLHGLDIGD